MIYLYIIVLISSFLLTFLIKYIAEKKAILDIPNHRSSHTTPKPKGGGLAIAFAWYCGLGWLFWKGEIPNSFFYALSASSILVIVGFLDDIYGLKPWIRFSLQIFTAVLGLTLLGGLEGIDLGFITVEHRLIFTIIAFVGILWSVNLFNFLDGIDGNVASEIIFIALSIFLLFSINILFLLVVATLGFLFWNWPNAKIFMGDTGSTFLGYNIAIFAIYYQNINEVSILIWLILSTAFWFDATQTLFRRLRKGEKLSTPHKNHAYQRIVQAGFSHQKTVVHLLIFNLILLGLSYLSVIFKTYTLLFLGLALFLAYVISLRIDNKREFE